MSAVATQRSRWSDAAIARLNDRLHCPWCDHALAGPRCARCGADYTVDGIGAELWQASQTAVAALEARQAVLDRVSIGAPSAPAPAPQTPARVEVAPGPPRSSATVQSVLAVAGAGLVAVAAIVFTFFNPDLTDALVRGLLVGAVTLVFLLGARVLARRGLQFSAEAVGALGLVFLGLDVQALTAIAPDHPWAVAASATVLAAASMVWVALRLRIRVWLWGALGALAFVPSMIGFATESRVLGFTGTAFAAFALLAATPVLARRFGASLRAERGTLTAIELLAVLAAPAAGTLFGQLPAEALAASLCALLAVLAALAMFSTRHPLPRVWSFLAGGLGTTAVVVLPFAVARSVPGIWVPAVLAVAAVVGAVLVAVLLPAPRTVARRLLSAGALTVVAVIACAPVIQALLLGAMTILRSDPISYGVDAAALVTAVALAALAAGLLAFAVADRRLHPPATVVAESAAPSDGHAVAEGAAGHPIGTRWVGDLGLWFAGLAALTVLSIPGIALGGRVAIGLALGALGAGALAVASSRRRVRPAVRVPIALGAHLLVLLALILSWRDADLAVVAGGFVVVAIAVVAAAVPASVRFVHVGVGYAYALFVFATALSLQGLGDIAALCLTTCAGAVTAIVATYLPFVRQRAWHAVLVVTAVPFLLGVAQVLVERSGWTALSTSLIFALALTLVVSKRPGLGAPLRAVAAAILVPALAVVVVCLGAQVLAGSGSPVVLPIVAVIAAIVLPVTGAVQTILAGRIGARDAALARIAIEGSTLLTAAIAVALAVFRDAAGLPTTLVVLLILGTGGLATAWWAGRRYGWAIAGAAFTGALWCVWGLTGVTAVEPYLLPPALGAAAVGAILTGRGIRSLPLYAAGLALAVIPLVVLTALVGPPVRAYILVAAAWALVALAGIVGGDARVSRRLRVLRPATLVLAIVAASAGAVQGVRFGLGLAPVAEGVPTIVAALGIASIGAMAAALGAGMLRRIAAPRSRLATTRWLLAPALVYVVAAAWPSIDRDWFTIWTMWTLMMLLLAAVVVIARSGLRHATTLPPVWFVYGLAFATAIVAWSPRDLRVEWFSLPLGLALLAAGALAMHVPARDAGRSLASWPAGFRGSWALLAPGILVMLSASVAATFTDPLTWRAILVIVLALVAILAGASRRLAAPFLIGIVVLPVENVIAFLVQIGRGIESMPWWITLAVVGAVLLIIAVTYERRAGEEAGIAARLRDLA